MIFLFFNLVVALKMSVDIFGRPSGGNSSRGPPGPPGPQGPKGEDLNKFVNGYQTLFYKGSGETKKHVVFYLQIQKKMLNGMVKKLRNGYHDHQKRTMLLQ